MKAEKQKNKPPERKNLFKVAFSEFTKSGKTQKMLAFIIFIASIAVPILITDKQWYLWSMLVGVSSMILYFSYKYSKVHKFKTFNTVLIFTIGILTIGGLKYGLDYYKHQINPCGDPETLYEYFDCGVIKEGQYRIRGIDFTPYTNLKNNESIKVKYESHLTLDFENMTYNVQFYCHNEVLMLWFGEIAPMLVDSIINKNLFQENAIPNVMRDKATTLKDLTFTKIVYLYLDTYVNAHQEQKIKASFEKHEPPLKVILRTRLYPFHKKSGFEVTPE